MSSDEIKKHVKEWVRTKQSIEFDYTRVIKTIQKFKHFEGFRVNDAIHFDFTLEDIVFSLENIQDAIIQDINLILDLVNEYHYYLNMSKEFSKQKDDEVVNIKKLDKIIKLFDDDFIDFLDKHLHLDKTLISSKALKISDNYQGVIKYYLQSDFIYSLKDLQKYFKRMKKKNELSIKSKDIVGSRILKPKIAYRKEFSEQYILKCLHFKLLQQGFSKEISLSIIESFFITKLYSSKPEHSFDIEVIEYIQTHKNTLFKDVHAYFKSDIPTEDIPNHIQEIEGLFNASALLFQMFNSPTVINPIK